MSFSFNPQPLEHHLSIYPLTTPTYFSKKERRIALTRRPFVGPLGLRSGAAPVHFHFRACSFWSTRGAAHVLDCGRSHVLDCEPCLAAKNAGLSWAQNLCGVRSAKHASTAPGNARSETGDSTSVSVRRILRCGGSCRWKWPSKGLC